VKSREAGEHQHGVRRWRIAKDNGPHHDKASYRIIRKSSYVMPGADAWLNCCPERRNFGKGGVLCHHCVNGRERRRRGALILVLVPYGAPSNISLANLLGYQHESSLWRVVEPFSKDSC